MKYAVIRTGGKQYKISEGDVISVERLATTDKVVTFSDVLLYAADADVIVGSPIVTDIVVTGTLMGDIKGEKIRVSKFKAKARYRRVTGHRQALSEVKIESIAKKGSAKVSSTKVAEEKEEVAEKKTVKKAAPKSA